MAQARVPEKPNLNQELDHAQICVQLKEKYTRGYKQRLDFISLYEKVPSNSFLIFEFEYIEQTYKWLSPERSHMYAQLHQILGEVNLDERFIKLVQLRSRFEKDFSDEIVKCKTWSNKAALQKEIDKTIRYLVTVKEKARINRLLHLKPDLAALKNNIKEHYQAYKGSLIGRFFSPNPQREAALTFVDFFSATCDEMYGTEYLKKSRDENQKDPEYIKNYQRHVGIFLFELMQIYNSYTVRSPGWSSWFREGLVAIGYTSLDDIPISEKILWLNRARKHLEKVEKVYSAKPGKSPDKNAYQELLEEWKTKRKMPNLDDLHYQMGEIIQGLEKLQHENKPTSFLVRTAQTGTATLASTLIQTALFRGITSFGVVPATTTAIGGLIGGPIGAAVGVCISPAIGAFINYLMIEKVIPWVVGYTSSALIERIGNKGGEIAAVKAFAVFTNGGLSDLKSHYDKVVGDNFSDEFVMALLALPDDMVSKADKKTLRKTWGIPDPDLPKTITYVSGVKFYDDYAAKAEPQELSSTPVQIMNA